MYFNFLRRRECLGRSRLMGLRLTPAMALPFCRQAFALSLLLFVPDDKGLPCTDSLHPTATHNKKALY